MKGSTLFERHAKNLSVNSVTFPKQGNKLKLLFYLNLIKYHLLTKRKQLLGSFSQPPNKFSTYALRLFADLNPYHYGEYLARGKGYGLDYFESQSTREIVNLYKANPRRVACSLVSSATEGILYSLFTAKQYYLKQGYKNMYVLFSDLTDKSVLKSSKLLGLTTINIGIDEGFYMSYRSLEKSIIRLGVGKRKSVFIICLTLGYKKTGTSDSYEEILSRLKRLKSVYRNVDIFVLIDAAIEGFVRPFVESFRPFSNPLVGSVVFDTHKLFFTPYTSGVVVLKKVLLNVDKDFNGSILESRSGLNGISLWSFINAYGYSGIKRIITRCQNTREYFLLKISKYIDPYKVIISATNLSLTFDVSRKDFDLFEKLEESLPVRANILSVNGKKHFLIKIYFFPKIDRKAVDNFIEKRLLKTILIANVANLYDKQFIPEVINCVKSYFLRNLDIFRDFFAYTFFLK